MYGALTIEKRLILCKDSKIRRIRKGATTSVVMTNEMGLA
jgi:hypothetical protein